MRLLATKEDIRELKEGVSRELEKITEKYEILEGKIFDLEENCEKLRRENVALRRHSMELSEKLEKNQSDLNDLEQYGRRRNLRVFNVKESAGETAADVTKIICSIFTDKVGVSTCSDDLEACHRVGRVALDNQSDKKTHRTIIVSFKHRYLRDQILSNRKKLKGQHISVGEDLTPHNARLCQEAYKHSASMSSWTKNGKIFAKLKNGKSLRVGYGSDVNKLFNRAMNSPETVTGSEEIESRSENVGD